MEPTDRPETYTDQLVKFKVSQATREVKEAMAVARKPPRNLDNGQIYDQCPRCNGAMLPGPGVCPACEQGLMLKWAANVEEERKVMRDGH